MTALRLKRVYDAPEPEDGTRILVDRLWPRGLTKDKARIDLWLKDISPSDALRQRFHGHPAEWDAFVTAYSAELRGEQAQQAAAVLFERLEQGPVTLLYAARDQQRNNAVALRQWLDDESKRATPSTRTAPRRH